MHTHPSHSANPQLRWRAAAAVTFWACKQYAIAEEMQYPLEANYRSWNKQAFWEHSRGAFFFFFSALHKSFCLKGLSIYGNLEIPHLERKQSSSATLEEQRGEKLPLASQGSSCSPAQVGTYLSCQQSPVAGWLWGWKAKPLPAPTEASAPF